MKKIFWSLLLSIIFLLPFKVMALPEEFSSYKTMNLDEALTQEKISHDFSKYKETDDQVVIYLFRGNGCGFCRNFLTFLNNLSIEYHRFVAIKIEEKVPSAIPIESGIENCFKVS